MLFAFDTLFGIPQNGNVLERQLLFDGAVTTTVFINSEIESLISHFRGVVGFSRRVSLFEMQAIGIVVAVTTTMVIFNNVIGVKIR